MRNLLLLALLLISGAAGAQKVIDITNADIDVANRERQFGLAGGSIFPADKYVKVKEGSPYYADEWTPGSLVMDNGATFKNLELKLDLLNHEVHYKDEQGREMILAAPARELIFHPGGLDARIFVPGKPWADVDKKLANAWLQVLVNDKVSLLLDTRKKVTETSAYASSTFEQTIDDKQFFFIQKGGHLLPVNEWSDLFDLLGDKRAQLKKYAKVQDLTGEAPIEYADLVAYYNRL